MEDENVFVEHTEQYSCTLNITRSIATKHICLEPAHNQANYCNNLARDPLARVSVAFVETQVNKEKRYGQKFNHPSRAEAPDMISVSSVVIDA